MVNAGETRTFARQVQQRLAALRAAGIEFVPVAPPIQVEASGGRQPPVEVQQQGADAPRSPEPDTRRLALDILVQEVAGCSRCPELFSTRTQTVFGVGPLDPDLCFVGEAPGADEDRLGEPFVGAAGKLLNKIIAAMGLRRDEVYICNTLKCRPPSNATPTAPQLANCRPFFDRQLDLIRPKFLCCLGGVAAKHVLNTSTGITKLRGRVYDYRGIPVMCTYHPSYLLRQEGSAQQKAKAECWEDMKMLLREMGRPVPGK